MSHSRTPIAGASVGAALLLALLVPATVVAISPDWTRHLGTKAEEAAGGIAADGSGLTVVGTTGGNLKHPVRGGSDAFIRRYDRAGKVLWTRQSGRVRRTSATTSRPSGRPHRPRVDRRPFSGSGGTLGIDDLFVRRYGRDGHVKWTRQFGTSVDEDPARSRPATVGCSSSG